MPRPGRRAAALAFVALCAAPAGLSAPPAIAAPPPAPVAIALQAAAAATTDDLAAGFGELPGRGRLALRRAAAAALVPLAPAETLQVWRRRARVAASLAATLHGVTRAAGGSIAAADRTLDAAALAAVAAFALQLALRRRAPRR